MFKLKSKDDAVLIVLLVMILMAIGFLFFKKSNLDSESAIKLEENTSIVEKEVKEDIVSEKKIEKKEIKKREDNNEEIFVQVGGAVAKPGVYRCQKGERVYQVLKRAGGGTKEASLDGINLVRQLEDDSKIIVPKSNKQINLSSKSSSSSGAKISINSASKEELEKLSGVGPTTAQKIIDYRKKHNFFKSVEELKKVSGIGEKTFEHLKSQIRN